MAAAAAAILPAPLPADVREALPAARKLAAAVKGEHRLAFARAVVLDVVSAYWRASPPAPGSRWPLRRLPSDVELCSGTGETANLARTIGTAAAALRAEDAGYLVGVLYTGMMPVGVRAERGAYYTPPALCERLLDLAAAAGVDWRSARVLDPACGGGAFLSPVARRMAESLADRRPAAVLSSIHRRLAGFELDPFAAWLSQVFLDATLRECCGAAAPPLDPVVRVCDSLEQPPPPERFDLVVGNPPYGRVTLSPRLRAKFKRSLFGHANLYGVFTDLALRLARPGGVIGYVTPTSFLAGEYFKALRALLGREAPPVSVDFIATRTGVFADVLQETLLAVYRSRDASRPARVHFISPRPDGSIETSAAGSFRVPDRPALPWLVPRTRAQTDLLRRVRRLPCRLADYGYTVSTGPLVWNRHRDGLRDEPGWGCYPLVWAESVRPDGVFEFRAEKRNHKPYFRPTAKESWVVTRFPCALVQRTTAKEQCRRLIAAELPASFIARHGAVVIENHLNMIRPLNGAPKVSPAALTALLNTDVVDQVFRCINGSVAVSAYELRALPLPPPEAMQEIESLIETRAESQTLRTAAERLYATRTPG